jgi:predicted GNAT family N-acyltransferase
MSLMPSPDGNALMSLAVTSVEVSRERVTIVRSVDDLMRVATIRSIVYIGNQCCPFEEEFDGNDFCGMHLIGWIGDEPAASLRIRFFGTFAKLERLAVRPEFRRSAIAFKVVRFGLRIAARKGFRLAYGHAQVGLEDFWGRFGAKPISPIGSFSFSGRNYTEMMVELPETMDAIAIGMDPAIIIRPEGDWDRPGILERRTVKAHIEHVAVVSEEFSQASWPAGLHAGWRTWRPPQSSSSEFQGSSHS